MAPVRVLFSDLDGTLAHYEKDMKEYASIVGEPAKDGAVTIEYNQLGVQKHGRHCPRLADMFMPRTHSTTSCVVVTVPLYVLAQLLVVKHCRNVHWPPKKINRGSWGGRWSVFAHPEKYPTLKSREIQSDL